MKIDNIIQHLLSTPLLFVDVKEFSERPGIYAFFYESKEGDSNNFPFKSGELLYIGKTESSQRKRNANTHFKSGKTGSSTFRKSLGAILLQQLDLKPVARNDSDYQKGKVSHFKFNELGEEALSKWMMNHISMTFYEHNGDAKDIDQIESTIIRKLIPPLNLSKNRTNPHKTELSRLRKNCATIAYENSIKTESKIQPKQTRKIMAVQRKGSRGLYTNYWEEVLPNIIKLMSKGEFPQSIQLDSTVFKQLGNRKKYSFRIDYNKIRVVNSIQGSAVARDLAEVFKNDSRIRELLSKSESNYIVRMDSKFILWVDKDSI